MKKVKFKKIKGWGEQYLLSSTGQVLQLRPKHVRGFDLRGHYVLLDDGVQITKQYVSELLIKTFNVADISEAEGIVELLAELKPKFVKKMSWEIVDHYVIISFPAKSSVTGQIEEHRMKLICLRDVIAIFDEKGKYRTMIFGTK